MSQRLTGFACWRRLIFFSAVGFSVSGTPRTLDLKGYLHATGAITVQHQGDTVDPYFALQAIELAQSHGLNASSVVKPWGRWLAQKYVEGGHLGRYCQSNKDATGQHTWHWCKPPDADDASLAMWWQFLNRLSVQDQQAIGAPHMKARAQQDLQALLNPQTGVYNVSLHIPHSLFMDNLEIWSVWPSDPLRQAIQKSFWDPAKGTYRVSSQSAHPQTGQAFYPDGTAQIYPLLVSYTGLPGGAAAYYQRWMRQYRSAWLAQIGREFPWGVIALIAWKQGDLGSMRCWQSLAAPWRHSAYWTVTDEVVTQILPPLSLPGPSKESCT